MVIIRLSRTGGNKNPFYHIVVADRRRARDSRFIERIGYYNPLARGKDVRLQLEQERIAHWLQKGAKPSERVAHLIHTLEKSPDEAQKAGPRRGDVKKAQVEAALKAKKKAEETQQTTSEPSANALELTPADAEDTKTKEGTEEAK